MVNNLPVDLNFFPSVDTHALLTGPAGLLEILTQSPSDLVEEWVNGVVVICHPNPLQGGTMNNKVVYTLAKAFLAKGFKVVRFNYRGVGQSQGEFGQLIGEVADLDAVIAWVKKVLGDAMPLSLAGFSFGAYISAHWAISHDWPIEQLISVAPTLDRRDYDHLIEEKGAALANIFSKKPNDLNKNNWIILQGDEDEVVSAELVYQWVEKLPSDLRPYITLEKFPEAGHFFHGKLVPLKEAIMKYILTK